MVDGGWEDAVARSLLNSRSLYHRAAFAALCVAISSGPAGAKATYTTFNDGRALAINAAGTVTGPASGGNSFIRTADGTFTTFSVPGASGTGAQGINDGGEIAGSYADSSDVIHGFLRAQDGTITTFDAQNADHTWAYYINNNGDIAGVYHNSEGTHGFVRAAGGRIKTFDVAGGTDITPGCINDKGAVVGSFYGSDQHDHGFLRAPNGTITTIDVPGATSTYAGCINSKGVVTGGFVDSGGNEGFIRAADGTITTFIGRDCNIFPGSINRKGVVTGACQNRQHLKRVVGFVRKLNGTVAEFHIPSGGFSTMPFGINDAGVIAGSYNDGGFLRFP